jgi:hypothetical protein
MRWTGLLESLLLSASALVLWRLMDRFYGPRAGTLAAVMFLGLIYFPSRSGMETSLFTFLVMLALAVVALGRPWDSMSPGPAVGFGLVLGALMLTRLDSIFYVGALLAIILVEGSLARDGSLARLVRRCALATVVAACLVAPYLAYNLLVFGHVMPISGAVKSAFPVPGWHYPQFSFTAQERLFFVAASILAPAQLGLRFGSRRADWSPFWRYGVTPLSLGVIVHHVYSALFMKWGVFGWHFALGRILTCVLAAILIERVLARLPKHVATLAWASACLVLLLSGGFAVYRRDWGTISQLSWRRMSYDTAVWVRDHLPEDAILAMKDSGHMALISGRRVVNLDGIVNNFDYQERMRQGQFEQYLRESGVNYFVIQAPVDTDQTFRFNSWSHLYEVTGGSIDLPAKDEVYRSATYGPSTNRVALVLRRMRN